ncbi:PBECR2 nuclease fold domain-containing protein [Helicobacter sp. T3_23-1059]
MQELATISNQNPKNDKITTKNMQGQNTMQIKQNQNGDYLLKDSEGKNHIVRKEVAQKWLKEFGLNDLSQSYKPNLSEPIKSAINKDIEINTKDLLKLINKGRTKYIKDIKLTFEKPKMVFIDEKDDLIFAKELSDRLFFVSVSRDYGDNYLNVTLSPKKDTILQNKLKKAKKVVFDKSS